MKILLALALLTTPSAFAGGISCYVHPQYPQVSVRWDKDTVKVEVVNPRGFKGMPQFEAPVSQDSMPMMDMQSKALAGLGDSFAYAWDKKKCEFSADHWLVSCSGGGKNVGPANDVRASLFTTAKIEETSLNGKNTNFRLRFVFDKGDLFFAAIPFPLSSCHQSED